MSGGYLESEGFHDNSELSTRSHCRFNTRTVVLYPIRWTPLFLIVSLSLAFPVFRYLVFEGI